MIPHHSPSDFRIAVRAAIPVAVVVVIKVALDRLGWDVVELNALYSGLVAGSVFLIGFLLAGTLADYKESEKLPADLAGRLKAIGDECDILHGSTGSEEAAICVERLVTIARSIRAWLHGEHDALVPLDAIDRLNDSFRAFEPLTQPNFIVRLKQEQASIRQVVLRIDTIKRTSFIGSGYLIAEATSVLLIIALLVASTGPLPAELFLIGVITFLLGYMILLIWDIDDPFDYGEGRRNGTAEVSLRPLDYAERSLAGALDSMGTGGPPAGVDPESGR